MSDMSPEAVAKRVAYRRARMLDELHGVPRGRMPRAEVVAHVTALRALGFGEGAIASAAGLSGRSVRYFRSDASSTSMVYARRFLELTPELVFARAAGHTLVPAFAAVRRMEALQWMGWRYSDIEQAGRAATGDPAWCNMLREPNQISASRHRSMCAAFDVLSGKRGGSRRTSAIARNRGFLPPLAWDDDTIDDPTATPDLGAHESGTDLDEFMFLVRGGEEPARAARRLSVTESAIERAAYRHERADVLQALRAVAA